MFMCVKIVQYFCDVLVPNYKNYNFTFSYHTFNNPACDILFKKLPKVFKKNNFLTHSINNSGQRLFQVWKWNLSFKICP